MDAVPEDQKAVIALEETTATFSKNINDMTSRAESSEEIQRVVKKLLLSSWICEVKVRNEWPEVCFERPDSQYEAHLWIDSEWRLAPSPPLPAGLSERQRQMIWLGELSGQEVRAAECTPDGGLDIEFMSNLHLIISGMPSDPTIIEPWILSEVGHKDGIKVVGSRGTR